VRHDAHFGVGQLRVALDTVDQRRAARGRGEQPLEYDQRRAIFHDRLERLDRFRVSESKDFAVDFHPLAESGHQILSSNDQCGRRHPVSLA
jgi:hypothetical protein